MRYLRVLLCYLGLLSLSSLSNALSCEERYGRNCYSCNEEECTGCHRGYCGSACTDNCTGSCRYDCHKTNCSCTACADGYYGDNCSSSCSGRCYKVAGNSSTLCKRNGACSEGCKYGFCSKNTACSTRCSNCVDDDCDSDTCKCRKGETPKVPSADCENCRNPTCREGVCIGCKDGLHGEHCEKKCTNCDICYQFDGECIPQYKNDLAWCWSYAGVATLACIVSGIFLYLCKYRRRYGTPGPH